METLDMKLDGFAVRLLYEAWVLGVDGEQELAAETRKLSQRLQTRAQRIRKESEDAGGVR